MKRLGVLAALAIAFVGLGIFGSNVEASATGATTQVYLTIDPGDICIEATGSVDFGTYTISSSYQTVSTGFSGTGDEYFVVDDLKGADSGYYTTIQVTDLSGTTASGVIDASNISMKVD